MKIKGILSIILLLLIAFGAATFIDSNATQVHDEAMKQALAAFGIAKGLNAVISLIQGTELSVTPIGIGLTFSVGEVLDPLNDLIERFSWVMLAASVSLGIQKLLLVFSAKMYIKIFFILAAAFTLLLVWYKPLQRDRTIQITLRLFIVLLLLRFGAIMFIYTENVIYNQLMAQSYAKAMEQLKTTENDLVDIKNQKVSLSKELAHEQKSQGDYALIPDAIEEAYAKTSQQFDALKKKLDIETSLNELDKNLDSAYEQVFNLITIFVVQSILLPLLFLWLFIGALKWAFAGRLNIESFK